MSPNKQILNSIFKVIVKLFHSLGLYIVFILTRFSLFVGFLAHKVHHVDSKAIFIACIKSHLH